MDPVATVATLPPPLGQLVHKLGLLGLAPTQMTLPSSAADPPALRQVLIFEGIINLCINTRLRLTHLYVHSNTGHVSRRPPDDDEVSLSSRASRKVALEHMHNNFG